ncbi:MAG: hypothetical protein HUU26_07015 [Gemmatimonadaceae bacterium]|nr:hypothetical protein [Gemmatimonadaceae bacterium]
MPRRPAVSCLLLALLALLACAEASGPAVRVHDRRLLIAGTEDGAIVVDLDWRGIIRRSGPRFLVQGPSAENARGSVLSVGRLASEQLVMTGLDVESGLELWRLALADGATPVSVDGVQLGATLMAVNPSRPEVFLSRAFQNGVGGVAGFDYQRQRITRFFGPVSQRLRAVVGTPAAPGAHEGCLVLGLDSQIQGNTRGFLHRVCGSSYAARDSVLLPLPSRTVLQMELTADGQDLIVMTNLELLRYDAATLALELRADRPQAAPFFQSGATGRLIIPDVGSDIVASSGIIYILDANLELASIVDLRVLPFGERPLGILGAEESADRKWLYIVGGIRPDGPLYGPEKTHVVVVSQETGTVADVVRLDTYGGGKPILVP